MVEEFTLHSALFSLSLPWKNISIHGELALKFRMIIKAGLSMKAGILLRGGIKADILLSFATCKAKHFLPSYKQLKASAKLNSKV